MTKTNLMALNERLFNELDKLDAVDMGDEEAVKLEIERAKTIGVIATKIIDNARTCIQAAQVSTAVGEAVSVPKGLLNG